LPIADFFNSLPLGQGAEEGLSIELSS